MKDTLDALFDELDAQMRKRRADKDAIYSVHGKYNHIRKFANNYPQEANAKTILNAYIASETDVMKKQGTQKVRGTINTKRICTAKRLLDIYEGGPVCWRRNQPRKLSPYYDSVLQQAMKTLNYRYRSAFEYETAGRVFFTWLQKINVNDIKKITPELIWEYINLKAESSTKTAKNLMARLKTLFSELVEREIVDPSCLRAFTLPIKNVSKLLPPANPMVLRDILKHIDRNTSIGKRDYAIILIAIVTGLRSVDIRKLKYSAFDWDHGEIRLTQSKTGQLLRLPLTQDIAEAVKDYWDNGRPESDDTETVFLSSLRPYGPLVVFPQGLLGNKCVKLGYNLNEVTFHGIRRLRGVSLVSSGSPLPIVMTTLGHMTPTTTEKYLSFDRKSMRNCALSLRLTYAHKRESECR